MIEVGCRKCGRTYRRKDLERSVACRGWEASPHPRPILLVYRLIDAFDRTAEWVVTKAATIRVPSEYTKADARVHERMLARHRRRFERAKGR